MSAKRIKMALAVFFSIITVLTLTGCKESDNRSTVGDFIGVGRHYFDEEKPVEETEYYYLYGTVKRASDRNPVDGIAINAYKNGVFSGSWQTAADGRFFFSLPVGFYELRAALNTSEYRTSSYHIKVFDNGTTAPENIIIDIEKAAQEQKLYDIKGQIRSKNQKELKLSNLLVELEKNGEIIRITQTDNDGMFDISSLKPGDYSLIAGSNEESFYEKSISLRIGLDGTIQPPVNLVFLEPVVSEELFSISGSVLINGTNQSAQNILVEIWKDSISGTPINDTLTTGEGNFYFDNLAKGIYFTRIAANNSKYRTRDDYIIRILENGETSPSQPQIIITPDASQIDTIEVTGHLWDAFTGSPIEYATVNLENHGNSLTNSSGRFSFNYVPEGKYSISFSKTGYTQMTNSLTVVESASGLVTLPGDLNYYLILNQQTNKGSIAGKVFDDNGDPLTNKIVRLYRKRLITQTSIDPVDGEISETDWMYDTTHLVTTRTNDSAGFEGTFSFPNITPTDSETRYMVYVGEVTTEAQFDNVTSALGFVWPVLQDNANTRQTWEHIEVSADTNTHLTNYAP